MEEEVRAKRQAAHDAAVCKIQPYSTDIPTLEEAMLLMEFYRERVEPVCQALRLHPISQAGALRLLDLFYLRYSILDFDPKHVMLAAILVASKVNGHHLTMDEWQRVCKADASMLMDLEVILLEAVDFNLSFYDPFTAAYACRCIRDDLDWDAVEQRIKALICYTDALLLHSAPTIVQMAMEATDTVTARGSLELYKAIDRRVILCRNAYDQNKNV